VIEKGNFKKQRLLIKQQYLVLLNSGTCQISNLVS